jgi:hypothetical protein
VAIGCVVLTVFSGLVVDMGIMWVGRRQAQNSADAGALAGAVSMAFDGDVPPHLATGPAKTAAYNAARRNLVIGEVPDVIDPSTVPTDVMFYPDNPAKFPAECADDSCIRVDVYRNQERANALPAFFTSLIGVSDQGVKATATARVIVANATDCLRPFGVPDMWWEFNTPPTPDEFNAWVTQPGHSHGDPITPPDVYQAPTATDPGSGYTVDAYYGHEFILKTGNNSQNNQQSGWYQPIDIPRSDGTPPTGGARYRANIASCNDSAVTIGTRLLTESGGMQGPTNMGIEALIDQDPDAHFNTSTNMIEDSCVPECGAFSPRTITLALYDTADFQYRQTHNDWSGCPSGGSCITVTNFLGFFVDRIDGDGNVVGYLVRNSGIWVAGAPTVGSASSFLTFISLIR